MDRINSDNVGYDAQGRRIFKDGPPATTINDQWCTGVQEEIMSVIESEGFAGNFSDNALLLDAITAAIARATDNYVVVHDLGTKNIVSQYSSFDLDLYISGGALAKPSGWKCRFGCSDGTGSYYCDPSTTYNVKGIGAASAVSALNFRMYGTGKYVYELDNVNSTWNIIEDNTPLVYARCYNSGAVAANTIINFDTKTEDKYNAVTLGAAWKFTAPKDMYVSIVGMLYSNGPNGAPYLSIGGAAYSTAGTQTTAGANIGFAFNIYLSKGQYIDIKYTTTSLASASAHIEILEIRR